MKESVGAPKQILFVDDDPNVLAGLRNVLRPRRHEWKMEFALGPEAALEKVAAMTFDIVISDMRMPHMDGATLLGKIKQIQPRAVRMILTGQTEQESVMKSVFIAHMFLSKPCDPVVLQGVVERAFRLNTILNSDELRTMAGRVEMLPAVPKTYVALNEALMHPNCSTADVAKIVEGDIGLCAKLLQLVNSAFFGLPRKITSLGEAITYLGTLTIKNLTMALETFSSAAKNCGLSQNELSVLQDHSLLTGKIGKHLFTEDKNKAEETFLTGILHEVGWLVPVDEASQADAGVTVDRCLLGAYLLGLWGLPYPITEAVACYREPQQLTHSEFEMVDAIYIAHHLATEARHPDTVESKLDTDYLAGIGIGKAKLDEMRTMATDIANKTSG
jgi:HD-like signal output (HDOD) protein